LPWSKRSDDHLDLARAGTVLEEDHYGLKDVKDRVLEFLAVRQLRARQVAEEVTSRASSRCRSSRATFPTPPPHSATATPIVRSRTRPKPRHARWRVARSCCSTVRRASARQSIAKSIARALGREYVRVSLGGARDEA
jgi:ATP-dependent Lon protease